MPVNPIPFELLHPEEARTLQNLYKRGLIVLDCFPWVTTARKRTKRATGRYRAKIAWIRGLEDRELNE